MLRKFHEISLAITVTSYYFRLSQKDLDLVAMTTILNRSLTFSNSFFALRSAELSKTTLSLLFPIKTHINQYYFKRYFWKILSFHYYQDF